MADPKTTKKDATENASSTYTIANAGRGPRFVNDIEKGRPVVVDPGRTITATLTDTEAKSAKTVDGLTLTKGKAKGAAAPAPHQEGTDNGGGDGGSADGRVTDEDKERLAAETPAYVAHEGLGRYHVFNAAGDKIAVPGEDGVTPDKPKAMTAEEAQTWATDAKVEFRGKQ